MLCACTLYSVCEHFIVDTLLNTPSDVVYPSATRCVIFFVFIFFFFCGGRVSDYLVCKSFGWFDGDCGLSIGSRCVAFLDDHRVQCPDDQVDGERGRQQGGPRRMAGAESQHG